MKANQVVDAGQVPEPFGATANLTAASPLMAISPLDGRYVSQTRELRLHFSEFALIKCRFKVEVEWLIYVLDKIKLRSAPHITPDQITMLRQWVDEFGEEDAIAVKKCEIQTRHDVKAVEYHLRNRLAVNGCSNFVPYAHFCCTSEDINNISHALMLRGGLRDVWRPAAASMLTELARLARSCADLPMLSRTHGQPASPTTLGKELAIFVHRFRRQLDQLDAQPFLAKFSGAVGNYNAHTAAYAEIDWVGVTKDFLAGFELQANPATTQIESHDYMAELFHGLGRTNTILIDMTRDIWMYISFGYFRQHLYKGEVGSSTMPHKINPIDFENAEANAGISNAILEHLAAKLPISRLQRDLSDSSAIRTVGMGIGHALLALKGCLAGLLKVDVDANRVLADLNRNWAVLGEAIQTILRKHGAEDAYERIKEATQDREMTPSIIRGFVERSDIPEPDRSFLLSLTPASFIGLAPEIARSVLGEC